MVSMEEVTERSRIILGIRVDGTSYQDAAHNIVEWAADAVARHVCVANVHMTMVAVDDPRSAAS